MGKGECPDLGRTEGTGRISSFSVVLYQVSMGTVLLIVQAVEESGVLFNQCGSVTSVYFIQTDGDYFMDDSGTFFFGSWISLDAAWRKLHTPEISTSLHAKFTSAATCSHLCGLFVSPKKTTLALSKTNTRAKTIEKKRAHNNTRERETTIPHHERHLCTIVAAQCRHGV